MSMTNFASWNPSKPIKKVNKPSTQRSVRSQVTDGSGTRSISDRSSMNTTPLTPTSECDDKSIFIARGNGIDSSYFFDPFSKQPISHDPSQLYRTREGMETTYLDQTRVNFGPFEAGVEIASINEVNPWISDDEDDGRSYSTVKTPQSHIGSYVDSGNSHMHQSAALYPTNSFRRVQTYSIGGIGASYTETSAPLRRRNTEPQQETTNQTNSMYQKPSFDNRLASGGTDVDYTFDVKVNVWKDGLVDPKTGENLILNNVVLKIDTQCSNSNWVSELTLQNLGAKAQDLRPPKPFCGFNGQGVLARKEIKLTFRSPKGSDGHAYKAIFYVQCGPVPYEMVLGRNDIRIFRVLPRPVLTGGIQPSNGTFLGLTWDAPTEEELKEEALRDAQQRKRVEKQARKRAKAKELAAKRNSQNSNNTDRPGGGSFSMGSPKREDK